VQRGAPNDVSYFTYVPQTPGPANNFASLKTIVNDPLGNVSEMSFDSLYHPVVHRDLAARSAPGKVTETENRPAKSFVIAIPIIGDAFEWNIDSLLRRKLKPNDSATVLVYERDLDQAASPAKRATCACCARWRAALIWTATACPINWSHGSSTIPASARPRAHCAITKKSPPILNIPT